MKFKSEIKRQFDCEVLVVGGGVAGFGAAIGAARLNKKVMLAEVNGYLGGCATAGLVSPFMTCFDRKGETQIIRGVFDDLVRRLVKEKGAVAPEDCRKTDGYSGYNPAHTGHLGTTPFDKEVLKRVMEDMCEEAGVITKYHYLLIGANKRGRKVVSCDFATKNGIYRIKAKEFIDCTGDGDLCYNAGAEFMYSDEKGEIQPPSTFFLIDGVNKPVVEKHFMNRSLDERTRRYMDVMDEGIASGEFPCNCRKVRIYEQPNDIFSVNMCQIDEPFDVNDPDLVAKAEIEGRKQVKAIVEFLKKKIPGFENIRLLQSSDNLGIRESRRIVGEYIMTERDVHEGRYFDDAVAVLSSTVDIHKSTHIDYRPNENTKNYTIPYRSLVVKDFDNLWIAGKVVSADREAHGAIRVMPPSMAMGQAAGIAAAIACGKSVKAKDVSYKELR
ncbi:MAG: FAD-dependent oxidoreductase, partial [Clostridia bacterium]|nr:FAD-dependent oxidoreductase [Clostridia bacterium]